MSSNIVAAKVARRFSTGTLQSIKQTVCDENFGTHSKVGARLKAFIVAFGTAGVGISCVSTVSMYNASEQEHKSKIYWNSGTSE